jgi:acyl carrier protein
MGADDSPAPTNTTELTIDNIIAVLKRILAEDLSLDLDASAIDEDVALVEEGLALDSIVVVQLIGIIEEKLEFEFEDSDLRMRSFESLTTLANVIKKRMQAQGIH